MYMRSSNKRIGITMMKAVNHFTVCDSVVHLPVRSTAGGGIMSPEGRGQWLGHCRINVVDVHEVLYDR